MNETARPHRSTRQDLLDAARSCVRRTGLAGASSRAITAEAHANLGAITYHFGSKDELVAEALFGELERRIQPALSRLDADGSAPERMLAMVQALTEEFERSRDDTGVYVEALLLAGRDPHAGRPALALYHLVRSRLAAAIVDLKADGLVPAWVDAEPMAALILSVANGIALQCHLDPDGSDHAAIAAQFAQLLLAAGPLG